MKSVYKYKLTAEVFSQQSIQMPQGAQILTCKVQEKDLCLWVLVDTQTIKFETRTLFLVGTGRAVPDCDLNYIGSYHVNEGMQLVFHLFEVI